MVVFSHVFNKACQYDYNHTNICVGFWEVNLKPTQFALQKIRIHGLRNLAKDEMNRITHDLMCTRVHHWKLKNLGEDVV
jgi:hypothetical protein